MSKIHNPMSKESPSFKSQRSTLERSKGHWNLRFGHSLVIGIWAFVICFGPIGAMADDNAVLHLANGGFVGGVLLSSESSEFLRWQSPKFVKPFEFATSCVTAVHYPVPATPPKPVGEYCLELSGGDVLFGDLLQLTGNVAELKTARFGTLAIERDQIRRLYRWSGGGDLIHLGPNGLAGWTESGDKKQWQAEGGQPWTNQPGSAIRGDFGIPNQAIIEFELSWKTKPDFVFALGVDNSDDETIYKRAFRFEVWDNELVVRCELGREADVDSIQEVKAEAGQVHLLAYLDQEQGRLLVFSPSGAPRGEISVKPRQPVTRAGLRLVNKRGDVRLERLRISRWNGMPPREVQVDKMRLHQTDGSIVYGQLSGFDPQTKTFRLRDGDEETTIAADRVNSVFLSPEKPVELRAARVVYLDGTRLSGDLTRFAGDHFEMQCPAVRGALKLPASGLRSLVFLKHDGSTPQTPEGRSGRLEMAGLLLHGRLAAGQETASASCLAWHPDLSRTASALRPNQSGRIVYRDPPPPQPKVAQPAQRQQPLGFADAFIKALARGAHLNPTASTGGQRTLHLRSGDTIPCEVQKIDEQGITFKTPLSDATFVTHDKVKAVELSVVDGPPKLNKTKRERLLTLPRLLRESPPTQLIRSKTGDFLRGRLIDMDDQNMHFEVRLETKEIPRDRISQIIWFHPDELTDETQTPAGAAADVSATRVQALRSDGIRLTFFPESSDGAKLTGKSEVLGSCFAELASVDQLLIGATIDSNAAELAYHRWRLHHAIEPKIAQDVADGRPDGRTPGTESPLVGKPAPDFHLELLGANGKKYRLSESKGRVVVLDFWATWCGPCIQSMPQVEKVVAEFEAQGVQLIGINLEEPAKTVAAMLERHKLHLTVALDQDGVAAAKYQATAIPQTVIVDREGNVARLFVGGGPHLAEQIREALRELTSAANPTTPAQPASQE
jgi:peroxiredoxin